jgi:NitT/TauT family transport system substrate-binding protein
MSRKKLDHFDWNSLRGADVLGWRPGSTPEFFLEYVIKQHGIDPKSVNLITNIGIPARIGAWETGTMPFGIFQEPEISQILEPAGYQIVASDGKEVGRADYTMFMATTDYLKNHADIAQAWTNAIAEAQTWMAAQPAPAVAAAVKDYFPGVPLAVLASSIARYRSWGAPYWTDSPVVLPQGIAKIEDIMVSGGVLPADKRVKYQDIVTTRFASPAHEKYQQSAK